MLTSGFHDVPNGQIAAVVTHLEMTTPQPNLTADFPATVTATHERLSVVDYRTLFRAIGEDWLWVSRLKVSDIDLAAILTDPDVETWVIRENETPIGLVEIDFREAPDCELAFFGLVPAATGKGLGSAMMALAQTRAFSRPINKFTVHTCTLDSPHALAFYQRHGFKAVKRCVELFDDPRGSLFAETAAPHLPLIRKQSDDG